MLINYLIVSSKLFWYTFFNYHLDLKDIKDINHN